MKLIAVFLALGLAIATGLLTGCSCPTVLPAEKVVTQTVKVPVPVARKPGDDVTGCWAEMPPEPTYQDAPGGLLLPSAQVPVLEASEAAKRRCDDAWRAWATSP